MDADPASQQPVPISLSSLVFVVVPPGSWLGLGEQISLLHWVGVFVSSAGLPCWRKAKRPDGLSLASQLLRRGIGVVPW